MALIWQKLLAPEPASSGYSCTITIGNAGPIYGYGDGSTLGIGSIDQEPVTSEVMNACFWIPSSFISMTFAGDVTSLVSSLNVWIGGVNYGGSGEWVYNSDDGKTYLDLSGGPSATSGTILLEIK